MAEGDVLVMWAVVALEVPTEANASLYMSRVSLKQSCSESPSAGTTSLCERLAPILAVATCERRLPGAIWNQTVSTPTWGGGAVSGCRSYGRAKGPRASVGAFSMALFLSGKDPRGHRRGAKGSCGTPLS